MDSSEAILKGIKDAGINFIVSVPCVNLKKLLNLIDEDDDIEHIPVTREEEGVGICAGAYLAGKKTAILMQNSGLGNCINGLKSLNELYNIPLVMIMSHRGTKGEGICGQIPMGNATKNLLEGMEFKYENPKSKEESYEVVKNSWNLSLKEGLPYSVLFDISYW